ncbi:hypothetical protein BH23PLA1_BH23PLA1_44940 [soil metagenome]
MGKVRGQGAPRRNLRRKKRALPCGPGSSGLRLRSGPGGPLRALHIPNADQAPSRPLRPIVSAFSRESRGPRPSSTAFPLRGTYPPLIDFRSAENRSTAPARARLDHFPLRGRSLCSPPPLRTNPPRVSGLRPTCSQAEGPSRSAALSTWTAPQPAPSSPTGEGRNRVPGSRKRFLFFPARRSCNRRFPTTPPRRQKHAAEAAKDKLAQTRPEQREEPHGETNHEGRTKP